MDLLNLKFIIDKDDNKTDVLIPINEWATIKEIIISHTKDELSKIDKEKKLIFNKNMIFPSSYLDILHLLAKLSDHSEKHWLEIYNNYFKYFESLNKEDIQFLYFLRKNLFIRLDDPEEIQLHIDMLLEKYQLTNFVGQNITINQYQDLINKCTDLNEISFLQYFSTNYKIILQKSDSSRIKRKAERDRLFIYDIFLLLDFVSEFIKNNFDEKEIYDYSNMNKKDIIEDLSQILYNGNKSQIYRAKQEAQIKIDAF